MSVTGKTFLGQTYYEPGARGAFKAKPQPQGLSDDLFTMKLIGASTDGPYFADGGITDEKLRVITVSSYEEGKDILRSGELLEALRLCFPPSNDKRFVGPRKVKIYNITPTTKATAALISTDILYSHALNANNPGTSGNKIRVKVTYGVDKFIEIGDERGIDTSAPTGIVAFVLDYTGDATTAALLVGATGITVTLAGQTDGSLNLSVPFAQYPTLGDVINFINQQQGYVATIQESPSFPSNKLDHVLAADAVEIVADGAYTLLADLWGQEQFITGQGLATLVPVTTRKPIDNMSVFKFLSGATSGVPGGTAVRDAILFAEKQSGLYTSILSGSLADAFALKASMLKLNSPDGRNESFGTAGAAAGVPLATRQANARAIASEYMSYGISPPTDFDLLGVEKDYAPYMLGVIHNAIKASNNPRETPTYKDLAILKTKEILTSGKGGQIEACIRAGGLVIGQKPNDGPWNIVRAITTSQSDNLIYNESSTMCTALAMVKDLREGFQANFIGEVVGDATLDQSKVQAPTEESLSSYLELKLQEYVTVKGWLRGSTLLKIPAFSKSYQVVIDGDAFYFLNIEGNVVTPINFIFFLLLLDVVRGSTTASGGQ